MIAVYVDDIVVSGSCDKSLNLLENYFKWSFEVRVDSTIKNIVGFFVQDSGSTVKMHNLAMIWGLLK